MRVPRIYKEQGGMGGGGAAGNPGGSGDGSVFVVNWLGIFARTCGVIMCIHVCALPNT